MKTFFKITGIALVSVLGVALVISLFSMLFTTPAQPAATTYAATPTGPVQVVAQQQHDSFWEDMFLYEMFFGGPRYNYWHPFGYGGYISHPYVFQHNYVVHQTTVINRPVTLSVPSTKYSGRTIYTQTKPPQSWTATVTTTKPSFAARTFGSSTATSSGFSRGFTSTRPYTSYGSSSFSSRSFGGGRR